MAGPSIGGGRWSLAVSLVVATVMTVIALVTVQRAGCADPGHYVPRGTSYELVGGCIEPGDLPVTPESTPDESTPDHTAPVRP